MLHACVYWEDATAFVIGSQPADKCKVRGVSVARKLKHVHVMTHLAPVSRQDKSSRENTDTEHAFRDWQAHSRRRMTDLLTCSRLDKAVANHRHTA